MQILQNGYHEELYNHEVLVLSEPLTEDEARFVYNVLELFSKLQLSYEQLSPEARQGLDKKAVRFRGFDGNNESALMGFARFLVEKLGRWSNLDRAHDLNSHMPTRAGYSRMLKAAPNVDWALDQGYSADQINAILDAWKHPGGSGA
jgi:uncharacterized protein YfbU (UPF0304 family)